MKAMLMSIRPEWLVKILNGEKTIEVRKKFPKDYRGWVYLYCSKNGGYTGKIRDGVDCYDGELYKYNFDKGHKVKGKKGLFYDGETLINSINGKVVARFWCDKVEEIEPLEECESPFGRAYKLTEDKILCCQKAQLTYGEYAHYLKGKNGYAVHISKLEIFDRPRELGEFYKVGAWKIYQEQFDSSYMRRTEQEIMKSLNQVITKAPQNLCYIEVE